MTITTLPSPTAEVRTPRRRDALIGRHAQFLVYAMIGIGALVVDIAVYALLALGAGWHPLLAHSVSTPTAAVVSFLANSRVTFKVTDRIMLRFLSFGVVAGIGYLVSTLIIWVCIDALLLDPLLAKALSLPVVLVLQFTLNKRITFKTSQGRTTS